MHPDDDLRKDVSDELYWDPKVDSDSVAVSAHDGSITLRGTVGSLREKRAAKSAAERVWGVIAVHNKLQVRLLTGSKREDADLRADVLQALMLDSLVPSTIDAKVDDGYVTLTGTAEWQCQREEAEDVASNIAGAMDVLDEIELLDPAPDAGDVHEGIKKAFKRNAKLDAEELSVTTEPGGKVAVSGTVSSWAEHAEALAAVWAAPGVKHVDDRMDVVY